VREIIDRAYQRAKVALTEQREVLDRLAALLIEKETIESEEFESLFAGVLPPRGTTGPTPRRVGEEVPPSEGQLPTPEPAPKRRRKPAPAPA
jgi:hypothetical protein